MPKNIVKRVDGYYASVAVPKDVQPLLNQVKYLKKLEARTPEKATLEAAKYVSNWKAKIKTARAALKLRKGILGVDIVSPLVREALEFREYLESETDQFQRETLELVLSDIAEDMEAKQGFKAAKEFYDIGSGVKTPLAVYYGDWLKSLEGYAPKTIDSYKRDTLNFIEHFKHLESLNKRKVKTWIATLLSEGTSLHTLKNRIFCACKHFYNYLDGLGIIDPDSADPFYKVLPKESKAKTVVLSKGGWIPFSPEEVAKIFKAIPKDDAQLQLLTSIGMYTGMRIEEICSLKTSQVKTVEKILCLSVEDSKTLAGLRLIPVHSKLEKLIRAAKSSSKDGYLIDGLTENKYGDRSNAIGKRFGRLKKELGFGSKQVFHSIRKCVITQLERAKVPEGAVADLVGHEKPTITYGLYSGGMGVKELKSTVELLKYPTVIF